MFKLCIFVAAIAFASAGIIHLDEGFGLGGLGSYGSYGSYGGIAIASPKVIAAPAIAVKAGATSYQNTNLISLHPTPVVTKAIHAAPIVTKVAAPSVSLVGVDDHLGLGGLSYGYGYGR